MADQTIEEVQAQVAELTTQLAEAQKGGGDASEEVIRLRAEKAELIEGRDKAKTRAREAEDAKLAEQGEFKTLSEQLAGEKKDLEAQLEKLTGTVDGYTVRDEAKLKTLLEGVPENLRDTVANNSGTLAEKIDLAEKLATVKPAGPGSRPGGDTHTQTDQEEYDQAVKDGDISKVMALKRALFSKG